MPRLSKIGAAALAAFGWTSGAAPVSVSYLVVAGGGGGGGNTAGGGGAGGMQTGTASLNTTLSYTVTVGAGGAGLVGGISTGNNGSNSVFGTLTASVGGGGGAGYAGSAVNGNSGGSGGGATGGGTGGSGTTLQGNSGGTSAGSGTSHSAGGGGGAGVSGGNGVASTSGGSGGNGTASSISASSVTYAGGGGGGVYAGTGGTGGTGGGGTGGQNNTAGTNGTANLGGGGGGGGNNSTNSGAGGSGIVIISYVGAQQFSGGVVTSSGGNTIHTFNTSGTLGPVTPLSANYLVVAGGGGGGYFGGGGGAGGLLSGSGLTIDPSSTYLVTVGSGGTASITTTGASGTNSAFSMVSTSAVGGGGSGSYGSPNGIAALNGGSGGGGGIAEAGTPGAPGTGTSGQGYAGGVAGNRGGAGGYPGAGGGGGAGAVGSAYSTTSGGAGGVGVASSISGTSTYYAGGGGGASDTGTVAAGGNGGGGAGGKTGTAAIAGTANTGGGGGGNNGATSSGNGGSGIVIISYAGSTQLMAGGVVTIAGGNVIHTFNSSGYLTPLTLLTRSLRFRSSASAYLNRTPSVAGNQQVHTFSAWLKYSTGTTDRNVISFGNNTTYQIWFGAGGTNLYCGTQVLGVSNPWLMGLNNVFRDPSAWYHIVIAVDTTQATAANRVKIYVNGVQQTSYQTANYPTQNYNTGGNTTTAHSIGRREDASQYFDGYLSEVNFIDGQALDQTAFGTFNSYGVWQPITYGGSYGTNGFRLPFTNNASTTTLGYDFSPNGNNWTTNNISVTAGSTYDSMTDVPTLTSATAANYPVWNPLDTSSNGTLSRANLQSTSVGFISGKASIAVSNGKWYWEITCTGGNYSGVGSHIGLDSVTSPCTSASSTRLGNTATSYSYNSWNGAKLNNSTSTAYGSTYTNGDVISVALDLNSGKIWWAKNGTWQASGDPAAGTNAAYSSIAAGLYTIAIGDDGGGGIVLDLNCGQQPFTYTPPTGYLALNTFNL